MSMLWLEDWFEPGRSYGEKDSRPLLRATITPCVHDILIDLIPHRNKACNYLREHILILEARPGRSHVDHIFEYTIERTIQIYIGAECANT